MRGETLPTLRRNCPGRYGLSFSDSRIWKVHFPTKIVARTAAVPTDGLVSCGSMGEKLSVPRKSIAATCFYFGELLLGIEMHIATWLVAVPWRNSSIGAFSGEFQNLRSDASSGKRTSAVRAPTGQLPSMTSLASTTS